MVLNAFTMAVKSYVLLSARFEYTADSLLQHVNLIY